MFFIEYASAFIACRFGESGVVGIELPDILIEWNVTGVYSAFAVVDDYTTLTKAASNECRSIFNEEHMIVGTSAMVATELDSVTNQYTELFSNPMLMWGRYRKGWFRCTLPISFQFHHVQMDGGHAAYFLKKLQETIDSIK